MLPEAQARRIIDQMLISLGWHIQDFQRFDASVGGAFAVREYPTNSGPADYALFVRGKLLGILEVV